MITGIILITIIAIIFAMSHRYDRYRFIEAHYDELPGTPDSLIDISNLLKSEKNDKVFIALFSPLLGFFIAWVMLSVQLNLYGLDWSNNLAITYIQWFGIIAGTYATYEACFIHFTYNVSIKKLLDVDEIIKLMDKEDI